METKATRNAYGETLAALGARDENVVALDADLSGSTKTAFFGKKFPDRFFNFGISEQDMMVTACGLATTGKIPFVSSFAMFATGRAFEQIRNSVALCNLNVKICASHAGITVGEDGKSHQALEDIAIMRVLPNMTVVVPADATEASKAIEAVYKHQGPCYVRLGRASIPVLYGDDYAFELGKAHVLREGNDVTLVGCGVGVYLCRDAAELLDKQGISARVLNLATVKPIDKEALISAAKETGAFVTVEEHNILGGMGSAVCEVLSQHCPVPIEMIGMKDCFGTSGPALELLDYFGLSAGKIAEAAGRSMSRKQS